MNMSFFDSPPSLPVGEAEQFSSTRMETSTSKRRRGYGKHT